MNEHQFGNYELLRKIAAGGMAEIFLARGFGQAGFFRDVVIKRMFQHLCENPTTVTMFQFEARLLAELRHPNIPQVFELGVDQGRWFMAMEYVDGHNVADVWRAGAKRNTVMPMHVAIGIVMQACEALHHAHDARDRGGQPLMIIHRDVTPQNIMVTRDGVAKVMDFGIAKTVARDDTEAGQVKGTFSYMAPEQIRARPLDRRADVFSLGVILYELTTGSRLFRGSDAEVMTAIVERDAPLPSERVPSYPPDLERIVMAALSRDQDHRIASAAHLALHLEDFAMRNGWLVGPRAVADHVGVVAPSHRVPEPELGLVPAHRRRAFSQTYNAQLDVPAQHVQRGQQHAGQYVAQHSGQYAVSQESQHAQHVQQHQQQQQQAQPQRPTFDPTKESSLPSFDASLGPLEEMIDIDDSEVVDVYESVEDEAESVHDGRPLLSGFEDEQDEGRPSGPVLLLSTVKSDGDDDYLSDLEKRLEDE